MKDNLFELLLNLFEKTLIQLKEHHLSLSKKTAEHLSSPIAILAQKSEISVNLLKSTGNYSTRVFSHDEQLKFTKASYQFLMRLASFGIIMPETLELIINKMLFSESRYVTLDETKWIIRQTLIDSLDSTELAFLDLVLYQREDKLSLH